MQQRHCQSTRAKPVCVEHAHTHARTACERRTCSVRSTAVCTGAQEEANAKLTIDKPRLQRKPHHVGHAVAAPGVYQVNVTFQPPRSGPAPTVYFLLVVPRGVLIDDHGLIHGTLSRAVQCKRHRGARPQRDLTPISERSPMTSQVTSHELAHGWGALALSSLRLFESLSSSAGVEALKVTTEIAVQRGELTLVANGLSSGTSYEYFAIAACTTLKPDRGCLDLHLTECAATQMEAVVTKQPTYDPATLNNGSFDGGGWVLVRRVAPGALYAPRLLSAPPLRSSSDAITRAMLSL